MTRVDLSHRSIELAIVPDLGGKIISLRKPLGREWIWHAKNPLNFQMPNETSEFATTNLGGIDDCLPSIKSHRGFAFAYSDHGQVWRLPATVKELSCDHCVTEVLLTEAPFRFRRTLSLQNSSILFHYELENLSVQTVPFIWSFHPLFCLESGDYIDTPSELRPMRVDYCENLPECMANHSFDWPQVSRGFDFRRPPLDRHLTYCAKLFFESATRNAVTLVHRNERLSVKWSKENGPYFGLWLTARAWNGHTHVAFEPTNYPADELSSVDEDPPALKPLAIKSWRFEVELS